MPKDTEEAVVKIAVEFPAYGQQRAANELKKKGILISASGNMAKKRPRKF